jgi:hypothetical protein
MTGRGRWLRNDGSGLIHVGESSGSGRPGPVLFNGGRWFYLTATFGDWISDAFRLNTDGWILGTVNVPPQPVLPALFIKDAGAPLAKLIAPDATILSAPAMNESGVFVASIVNAAGVKQLVTYTPLNR